MAQSGAQGDAGRIGQPELAVGRHCQSLDLPRRHHPRHLLIWLLAWGYLAMGLGPVQAQFFPAQFELSEKVHLDEADSATRAHLERVKAYLADKQWDEAVETLRQVMETHGRKVVGVSPSRYVNLADHCHRQIAALPAEALKLYRDRVDPLAEKWFEEAVEHRDVAKLRSIIEQMFCSSWGDDALWTLGEIALENGDFATARGAWEALIATPPSAIGEEQYRLATEHGNLSPDDYELLTRCYVRDPHAEPPSYGLSRTTPSNDEALARLARIWADLHYPSPRLVYPNSSYSLAEIRARLILLSMLEGNLERARGEVATYEATYPNAEGKLAGRQTNFARSLAALLAAAEKWPADPADDNWLTFAGNFSRNRIGARAGAIDAVAKNFPVELGEVISADLANNRVFSYRRVGEDVGALLSYFPVVQDSHVFWANQQYVFAFNLETGKPAWPGDQTKPPGVIYDNETVDSQQQRSHRGLGVPRFTLTIHNNRLYARMGSQVTSKPVEAFEYQPGNLVCLDLAAEGRIVWKASPEAERWSFEGPPVVDGPNVYVAMRRSDVRPQSYIACLDAETGQQRWRTLICSAETPGGGQQDEITHNLLTLNEGVLYLNTNLGAVAAVSASDGRIKWIFLYPRARKSSSDGVDRKADHFYRDLNPCIYHQGLVYAAPSDCVSILAIDATTGEPVWNCDLVQDAIHLLGVSKGMLVAGGNKLYWLDAVGGKVRGAWPMKDPLGYGRGMIAGDEILWTSRNALYTFDLAIARNSEPVMTRPPLQLTTHFGATGGNLLMADRRLLLTTAEKLYAFEIRPPSSKAKQPPDKSNRGSK